MPSDPRTSRPEPRPELAAAIAAAAGQPFRIRGQRAAGGGCINTALILSDGERQWFVKLNRPDRLAMFEAEAAGLAALAAAGAIRVPVPLCAGLADGQSFLVMEALRLDGRLDGRAAGRQLAALHRVTAPDFGWERDNTIGATPQRNARTKRWADFWRQHRLGFQLELAAARGYGRELQPAGDRLLADLDALLEHVQAPSLLHGDLWGGNIGATRAGEPAIFDPAVYFGDRETDLAMTELFGGFDADFQAAYREAWPLPPGYATRRTLYNLYHILNHLNLFGGGYLHQARSLIDRLLAELR